MSEARKEILAGVDFVQVLGTPGTMIVHGSDAEAIMTNKDAEVFIGAGQSGTGRVVVFSHDSYTVLFLKPPTSNHQLVKNIKSWVTYGSTVTDSDIEDVDSYDDFDDIPKTCKILVWIGMRKKSQVFYDKMKKWIENGGGMVCGATPWGYLMIYPDSTLEDMPLTVILNVIGIRYTDLFMSGGGNMYVSDNLADHAHLSDAIKASSDNITDLAKYGRNIEGAITYLSDTELQEFLPDINQLIEKHRKTVHCIPTKSNPVKTDPGRRLASLMCRIMIRTGQYNEDKVAPGITEFPGDFSTPPELTSSTVTASCKGYPARTFATGYYLPAGQEIIVSWSSIPSTKWSVLIGGHGDQLYHVNSQWRRWPRVQMVKKLTSSPLKFCSPFGGSIYLRSPANVHETVTVKFENIVPSPIFVPGKGPDWDSLRSRAGLWADVSGEHMTITLPSSSVRELSDPTSTMELWDEVVNAHYDLRGMDPYSGRGQWAITDEQPSAGYMHAGYPVVTMMDVADPNKGGEDGFLLNGKLLKTVGMWGMFHELGHNLQDSSWTFSGTGEVTCNIFTLHAMDIITGQKPWSHPWVKRNYDAMRRYLQAGAKFSEWLSNPGVALAIYAELARDFGWKSYKEIFREYNDLAPNEKPKTDDEKMNQWIVRFSKETLCNLCPVFDFWGFTIHSSVLDSVKHLPAFLHTDESTDQWAPVRAADIRRKYGISEPAEVMGANCSYRPTQE